jgi:hypothetical protein
MRRSNPRSVRKIPEHPAAQPAPGLPTTSKTSPSDVGPLTGHLERSHLPAAALRGPLELRAAPAPGALGAGMTSRQSRRSPTGRLQGLMHERPDHPTPPGTYPTKPDLPPRSLEDLRRPSTDPFWVPQNPPSGAPAALSAPWNTHSGMRGHLSARPKTPKHPKIHPGCTLSSPPRPPAPADRTPQRPGSTPDFAPRSDWVRHGHWPQPLASTALTQPAFHVSRQHARFALHTHCSTAGLSHPWPACT